MLSEKSPWGFARCQLRNGRYKAIPLVGGVIGGSFDGTTTYAIGRAARNVFITSEQAPHEEQPEEVQEFDLLEGWSEIPFIEDGELRWRTPQDQDRHSS